MSFYSKSDHIKVTVPSYSTVTHQCIKWHSSHKILYQQPVVHIQESGSIYKKSLDPASYKKEKKDRKKRA